ncbi:MAG: hypothetical protein NC428_11270 [Clostridium sp.]|nr:hypothetical protein [Clostridium sp.]
MIEKNKNYIMEVMEDNVLSINKKDIEQYLSEVKEAVENDRYRLDSLQIGGGHYGREGKKRFLYRVQKRDRVSFAEKRHREKHKR